MKEQNSQPILVAINAVAESHPDLDRAVWFATKMQVKLHVIAVEFHAAIERGALLTNRHRQKLKDKILNERRQNIERLLAPIMQQGLSVDYSVIWDNDPSRAITQAVKQYDCSWVIKTADVHSTVGSLFITPADWHVLRKCSCPVMLVKTAEWPIKRVLLAAVDPLDETPKGIKVMHDILRRSMSLAELMHAELHVVHAFSWMPLGMGLEGGNIFYQQYLDELQALHQTKTHELLGQYGIPVARAHVKPGEPTDVIPEVVRSLHASALVMGTMARTGIAGVFVGNTVEKVLDSVDCDVVTLKA